MYIIVGTVVGVLVLIVLVVTIGIVAFKRSKTRSVAEKPKAAVVRDDSERKGCEYY